MTAMSTAACTKTEPYAAPTPDGHLDLEAYRQREGLTYEALATEIGVGHASQARRYALGERWPEPDTLDRVVALSCGAVSILAMHHRRAAWLREHRGVRRVPVETYHDE